MFLYGITEIFTYDSQTSWYSCDGNDALRDRQCLRYGQTIVETNTGQTKSGKALLVVNIQLQQR